MRLDKILPSFPQPSFLAYPQQLRFGTRTVCILAACALTLFLVRKAFFHIPTKNTIPLTPPIPITKKNDLLPLSVEPQLATYLRNTLLISSQEEFTEKLGTQLDSFPSKGITTLSDILSLGLFMFISHLQEWEKSIAAIDTPTTNLKLKAVNEQISLTIERIQGFIHTFVRPTMITQVVLETVNKEISLTITGIQEFMDRFIKTHETLQALSLEHTKFDLTDDITHIQTVLTTLKTMHSNSRKDIITQLNAKKASLSDIFTQLQELDLKYQICCTIQNTREFMDHFIKTNETIQDLSSEHAKCDLREDIKNIQTALTNAANPSKKLHRNKKSLSRILSQLQKLDRKRQVCWLRGYLLQPNLMKFWNENTPEIQSRSLSRYEDYQRGIKLENLFKLGVNA